jgi:hypothetical protein
MNVARLISVAAHCALIGWLYYLSTLPAPPLVPDTILLAELVQPIYKPPPPPRRSSSRRSKAAGAAEAKRARVRPRRAPPPRRPSRSKQRRR